MSLKIVPSRMLLIKPNQCKTGEQGFEPQLVDPELYETGQRLISLSRFLFPENAPDRMIPCQTIRGKVNVSEPARRDRPILARLIRAPRTNPR